MPINISQATRSQPERRRHGSPALPMSRPALLHAHLLQHPGALLHVLVATHPERLLVLHDVRQHRASQEHHVLSARRVFDTNFEFLSGKPGTRADEREVDIRNTTNDSAFESNG